MRRVRETIAHRIDAAATEPVDTDALLAEGCFSAKEATRFSGLSSSQLNRHMDAGRLPYVRDNTARRIPRVALKQFLRTRLVRRDDQKAATP